MSLAGFKLRDADPRSAPVFDPNYLGDPEDMRRMVAGLREVLKAPALRHLIEDDPERLPGRTVRTHVRSRKRSMSAAPTQSCREKIASATSTQPLQHLRIRRSSSERLALSAKYQIFLSPAHDCGVPLPRKTGLVPIQRGRFVRQASNAYPFPKDKTRIPMGPALIVGPIRWIALLDA